MKLREVEVKEALHKLSKRGLPYHYDLNIYRGCQHQCAYCYAKKRQDKSRYAPEEHEIVVKTNIAEALEQQLKKRTWKGDIINLGGVCDSYQQAEKSYQLMPQILKIMIKYKNPIIISTKSDLIIRDKDLLDELGRVAYVNIVLCITSSDAKVAQAVEPGASLPRKRLAALKTLKGISAYRALHFFPILPLIADDDKTLETIVKWAREADVDYMMSAMLYMTGAIKANYMAMIAKHFPEKVEAYKKLYPKGSADKAYKQSIHAKLAQLRKTYQVNSNYQKFMPPRISDQPSLF